ncbi:hypothetical protein J3R30DRAFT_3488056, partial [Lentinula aciculospora]
MSPGRHPSPWSSSSPDVASQTFPNYILPRTTSISALNPNTTPLYLSPTSIRQGGTSLQREAMLGYSVSEGSVRAATESGRSNISGTVNGLNGHAVPEVPRTPENSQLQSRRTLRTVPLPSQSTLLGRVGVDLNQALKFEGHLGGRAMIRMDVAARIRTVLELANGSQILTTWATSPPLPSMTVLHPALPWSITVHATVTYVTVCDVLCAIYQSLQLPLHEEYWSFCLVEGYRVFPERYGRTLKRFHLLQGKTIFVGLSRTAAEAALGGEIWRMNFA